MLRLFASVCLLCSLLLVVNAQDPCMPPSCPAPGPGCNYVDITVVDNCPIDCGTLQCACEHDGNTYEPGERFQKDCNNCICTELGPACTLAACPVVCEHNLNTYGVGDSFRDECNTCTCEEGGVVSCTERACIECLPTPCAAPPLGCSYDRESVSYDENGCPVGCGELVCGCDVNGVFYQEEETFMMDCNACTCGQSGDQYLAICTTIACPPCNEFACEEPPLGCEYVDQEIVDFCPVNCGTLKCPCSHEGVQYGLEDSWQMDCNTCFCTEDGPACTEIACFSSSESSGEGCVHDGVSYDLDDSWEEACNTCTCTEDGPSCTEIACFSSSESSGEGCVHDGVSYDLDDSWEEACNTCTCTKDGPSCTEIACVTCEVNGVVYYAGESFQNDCNTCACTEEGEAICTLIFCEESEGDSIGTGEVPSSAGVIRAGVGLLLLSLL